MVLFRRLLGDVLRRHRQRQGRTLRDVAAAARISLGYLSEVERGRKEASSELLACLCEALNVSLADVLREVSHEINVVERGPVTPAGFAPTHRLASSPAPGRPVAAVPGSAKVAAAGPVVVSAVPVAGTQPAAHEQPAALVSSMRMHVVAA
jgi:transcriptional regulator with XRE-family HTH domain